MACSWGLLGIRALLAVNTADLPRIGEDGWLVGLDGRVLGFTLAISVATGLLFGLIPALQGSRADLRARSRRAGAARAAAASARTRRARSLVVTEVALALILLIGSALLIRTAIALGRVDPGFDTTNVLTHADVADGRRASRRRKASSG